MNRFFWAVAVCAVAACNESSPPAPAAQPTPEPRPEAPMPAPAPEIGRGVDVAEDVLPATAVALSKGVYAGGRASLNCWSLTPDGERIIGVAANGYLYDRPIAGDGGRLIALEAPEAFDVGKRYYNHCPVNAAGDRAMIIRRRLSREDAPPNVAVSTGWSEFVKLVDLDAGAPMGDWTQLVDGDKALHASDHWLVELERGLTLITRDLRYAAEKGGVSVWLLMFDPTRSGVLKLANTDAPPVPSWVMKSLARPYEGDNDAIVNDDVTAHRDEAGGRTLVVVVPNNFMHSIGLQVVEETDAGRKVLFEIPGWPFDGVRFSADGAQLFTVGAGLVDTWDVRTGERVHRAELKPSLPDPPKLFRLSPDARRVVLQYRHQVFETFDAESGKSLGLFRVTADYTQYLRVRYGNDGRLVAATQDEFHVLEPGDGKIASRLELPTIEAMKEASGPKFREELAARELGQLVERFDVTQDAALTVVGSDPFRVVDGKLQPVEHASPAVDRSAWVTGNRDEGWMAALVSEDGDEVIRLTAEELGVEKTPGYCSGWYTDAAVLFACTWPEARLFAVDRKTRAVTQHEWEMWLDVEDLAPDGSSAIALARGGALVRVDLAADPAKVPAE